MAETRADSEKISVVLEIQGDAETRERMRNMLLKTLQELQGSGTCMIHTATSILKLEIGAGA